MRKFEISLGEELSLIDIQAKIHESCIAAGWYEDLETGEPIKKNVGETLMLVVTEVAEAMEGYRKNLPDDHLPTRPMLEVELADAVIRIFDLAGAEDLDLAGAIREKFAYNQTRADHSRESRRADGGKKV